MQICMSAGNVLTYSDWRAKSLEFRRPLTCKDDKFVVTYFLQRN